jgi:hypothetical protein
MGDGPGAPERHIVFVEGNEGRTRRGWNLVLLEPRSGPGEGNTPEHGQGEWGREEREREREAGTRGRRTSYVRTSETGSLPPLSFPFFYIPLLA